ncbi:MAG: anhydro-N-acetylmuramic acid kinase [Betaproteobacteria bacterium]|nr:anhydro-N-acetylmuramic acid kinase [Betaproteobacteria bacterium]
MAERYIGLMSGTSLDGVDGVLVEFANEDASIASSSSPTAPSLNESSPQRTSRLNLKVLAHVALPFANDLKQTLFALNSPADNEIHRASLAANALTAVYAKAAQSLLDATQLKAAQVRAIGAHGQTVRHQPGAHDGIGYTTQLNNPSLLAEHTGIAVVADFRSRDIAAGGQGAPLVPVFHQGVFGQPNETVGVLNIGGIANLSVLHENGEVIGFDCGPGNALMDHWCMQNRGFAYDDDGEWARSGQVHMPLLQAMLSEPFMQQAPPKSTGRDLFHKQWLELHLANMKDISAVDVQATLTEFTALACANDVLRHAQSAKELIVCGGGALNGFLMERLQVALPNCTVLSSAERGMPPLQVEATAFAWLARQTVLGLAGNAPKVTGAKGARILGGIFPA